MIFFLRNILTLGDERYALYYKYMVRCLFIYTCYDQINYLTEPQFRLSFTISGKFWKYFSLLIIFKNQRAEATYTHKNNNSTKTAYTN